MACQHAACETRKFPLTNALDISEGEIESLKEKMELLVHTNNECEKNLRNSTQNEEVLKETITKNNNDINTLQCRMKEIAEKMVMLEKLTGELNQVVTMELQRRQNTIDQEHTTNSNRKTVQDEVEIQEEIVEEEVKTMKCVDESHAEEVDRLKMMLKIRDGEVAAQARTLAKMRSREVEVAEELEHLERMVVQLLATTIPVRKPSIESIE